VEHSLGYMMPATAAQGPGSRSAEELKSLVVKTLESNGVLGQIRAELRANVYKAIDNDDDVGASTVVRSEKLRKSPAGQLMAEIVAEFFEFYQFRPSLSVFLPESNLGKERRSRTEVALDAGLARVHSDTSILEQLISLASSMATTKSGEGWHSSASSTTASSPPPPAASSASTHHTAWESLPGNDTPPAGYARAQGERSDRTRAFGGGAGAAVVSALSTVVGGHDHLTAHKGRGPEFTPGSRVPEEKKEEVGKAQQDEAPEEVRELRKPRGKLPALSSTSPLGSSAGKELLPPLKMGVGSGFGSRSASGASVMSGIQTPDEEVSLNESGGGTLEPPLEEVEVEKPPRPVNIGVSSIGSSSAATPAQPTAPLSVEEPLSSPSGDDEELAEVDESISEHFSGSGDEFEVEAFEEASQNSSDDKF